MAKNVKLVAVKVFNRVGSTSTSVLIKGIDWVTANAVKPAVVTMSIAGPEGRALDSAVPKW